MLTGLAKAQESDIFPNRLANIRDQLELLSDSLAPGLNEYANLSVSGISLQTFLRSLAEAHNLNIQVDPSITITLVNNFTNVQVKNLLYFLCEEYQLDIRFTSTILSFFRFQQPRVVEPPPKPKSLKISYESSTGNISYDLNNDSLRVVAKEITRLSNRNVIVSGGKDVENRLIRSYIKEMPLEGALDKLAYTNGLKLIHTKDDVFILEDNLVNATNVRPGSNLPRSPTGQGSYGTQGDIIVKDSLVSLDVVNYPIVDVLNHVSEQSKVNYVLFADIAGNITANVKSIHYDDLLSLLFQGTAFTYVRKGSVYLIGQRTQDGFKTSEVVKLNFRTIDGIDKDIPSDLTKEVELKILKEQNAIILTGNREKIKEISTFIKLIDHPVPNILIEVIVAEAQKSFTLQTGIKAFLSDSVPRTGGQVFPNLDLTLSSNSVNNILGELNSRGIVNIGKVSPNFYATIQALESNNNIQIRSTPKLSTMNGSKANLIIGESQYYLEQTQNITGGVTPITSTTQRFSKVEANLAITISPMVSGNEHITLDIVAEFSNFSPPAIPNAPPGNKTRKFESKIRVKNEEMIILGGLEQLSKSESGSGTPLLSRIPVLKWIFSSKKKSKDDSRLIVFIKPTLVY